jgi:hypothetical protein
MTEQRQILQEKAKEVEEIAGLIEQYKAIGLADLQKVRAFSTARASKETARRCASSSHQEHALQACHQRIRR